MVSRRLARFGLALGLALLLASSSFAAHQVQHCGSGGVPKATLSKFDHDVLIQSAEALQTAEAKHLPFGFPTCPLRLINAFYIDCYDVERRVPLWGAYRLEGAEIRAAEQQNAPRKESFRTDPRLQPEQSATCEDFSKHRKKATGGDPKKNFQARGHTVPDADFRSSQRGQAYTYYLSNMTPQWQSFNGGIWARLEKNTRDWAKKFGSVQVISGAIFDKDGDGRPDAPGDADRMQPTKRVAVPTHYFRVLLRQDGTQLVAIALLLPHWKTGRPPGPKKPPDQVLADHLVSIKDIRERVGVDLLPNLAPDTKAQLESAVASELWPRN